LATESHGLVHVGELVEEEEAVRKNWVADDENADYLNADTFHGAHQLHEDN